MTPLPQPYRRRSRLPPPVAVANEKEKIEEAAGQPPPLAQTTATGNNHNQEQPFSGDLFGNTSPPHPHFRQQQRRKKLGGIYLTTLGTSYISSMHGTKLSDTQATTQDKMGVKGEVQVGPWGSGGGAYPYEFKPNGKITKICIRTGGQGGCIDSIAFRYIDASTGKECWSQVYGGEGGHLSQSMYIEEGEEIVQLSGTVGTYGGWTVITSLCFTTNKKRCEFGSVSSEKFSLPVKSNSAKFVGFHGRYGGYLDSIGAILEPK